jgi:tetratricopeptide (TPR) repeat protein
MIRLLILLLLIGLATLPPAAAQEATTQAQKTDEFLDLADRAQQSSDPQIQIDAAEAALAIEPQLDPWPLQGPRAQVRGSLLTLLGAAYWNRHKDQSDFLAAIANLNQAIDLLTPFPPDRAGAQYDLGLAYISLHRNADDLEQAIAAFQAALAVVTHEVSAPTWAQIEDELGLAYVYRIAGSKADNIEAAIAAFMAAIAVRTRETAPQDWAATQANLGIAYFYRIKGARSDNLEAAIASFAHSLEVATRESAPHTWAMAQNALGLAYANRIRGDQAANLDSAIAAYESALTVFTRADTAQEWAAAQANLGTAYANRLRGDRSDNLDKAIAAHQQALQVFTHDAWPQQWASTQNNLGLAFAGDLRADTRAQSLEQAIIAYTAALTVRTLENLPQDWAETQNNLGNAYANRILGDPSDNLEQAIAAYRSALQVFTPDDLPQVWAACESNLGVAYVRRVSGAHVDNLAAAVTAFRSALTVRSRDAMPREHLQTGRALGNALLEQRDWSGARAALDSARDAFLLLFGQGVDADAARELITEAGPLFEEDAYVTAQSGNLPGALGLLSDGRARLLDVALRRQLPGLSPQQQVQITDLSAKIRDSTLVLGNSQGVMATQSLAQLASLRRELAGIIKAMPGAQDADDPLKAARALLSGGGAIAVSIITQLGSKLMIVTAPGGTPALHIVDLPELTTGRIVELVRGGGGQALGGWLAAYAKNDEMETIAQHISVLDVMLQLGIPQPELAQAQAQYDNLKHDWLAAIDAMGPQLWTLFAGALDQALASSGVAPGARLIWLPTGALGLLPLGLATDPQSGRRLSDSYEIVYAPSLGALALAQGRIVAPAPPPTAVVVGDASSGLPYAAIEEAVVGAHFPGASIVLDDVSSQAVLAALPNKSYWHFATHGRFDWNDARNSALLLSQGQLTVDDLITAAESGVLSRPRLVVLSACETGLYDIGHNPEEFTGLPLAFMSLGAAGVLSTLWPVIDDATMLLVAKFYDLHREASFDPPAALQRAQAWLRSASKDELIAFARAAAAKGNVATSKLDSLAHDLDEAGGTATAPFAHPYYWGGFVYMGL